MTLTSRPCRERPSPRIAIGVTLAVLLLAATSTLSARSRPERRISGEIYPQKRADSRLFSGLWNGVAVDKPEDGTSRDTLTLELSVCESGHLGGVASGEFVSENARELRQTWASENRLGFVVEHRTGIRMVVLLELIGGRLIGEGIPLGSDGDRCEVTLSRPGFGSRGGAKRPEAPPGEATTRTLSGRWIGMAVDKPGDGTSKDPLWLELKISGDGRLHGTALWLETSRECKLDEGRVDGNQLRFIFRHRAGTRMSVTLALKHDQLRGEAIPIPTEEGDRCDIVLSRVLPETTPSRLR